MPDIEIIDGQAWWIIRGKKAGVTPARPSRREFISDDPKVIAGYRKLLDGPPMEAGRESQPAAATATKATVDRAARKRRKHLAPSSSSVNATLPNDQRSAGRWTNLPGWPRVLSVQLAAAYLSLSVSSFRSTVGLEVPAIHLTPGRIGWDRLELDAWVDRKLGPAAANYNPWDDD